MTYTTVLFDLDDTLIDSSIAADAAWDAAMASIGATDPTYRGIFDDINARLWHAVEDGDMTPNQVRNGRFERFVEASGVAADPIALADVYTYELGANGDLFPDAIAMLEDISAVAKVALITNGIGQVQRHRVDRLDLDRFFDAIIISGEVGVSKPGTEIFDLTFEALGDPAKESALIVGDNLRSDVAGGIAYGIDTCWYNPNGKEPDRPVTHQIGDLASLPPLIRGA